MAFETILITATSEQRLPALLEVARGLADRHRSRVVGLAVLPPPLKLPAPSGPPLVVENHRTAFRAEAGRMRAIFDLATAATALDGDWQLEDARFSSEVEVAVARGRMADLIVTSDCSQDRFGDPSYEMAEQLLVETGRPVLVVPRSWSCEGCGRRVLVAWNGSREAARAVFDALPLLREASHVTVFRVGIEGPRPQPDVASSMMCDVLSRHGVRASADDLILPRNAAGPALVSAVKAENADLLVMGGNGHWRFQEFVLGEATRHVLRHATVPVFMSH